MDGAYTAFCEAASALADAWLHPYLDGLDSQRAGRRREINDPIWGTISLTGTEVIVLDSPALQRLRRIRQLGVVHFVFPGATHTRFDHSIGVVSRVDALIQAANHSPNVRDLQLIDPAKHQALRLAALCHDVGHGFMSHVSEKALSGKAILNRLERAFSKQFQIESPQLSEIASFALVRTTAFRELLKTAWSATLPLPPFDISDFISDVIVGRTVDHHFPLLHELITGPFDADKLDYLTRDAFFCGVPQVVDIPRLIQKLRVSRLAPESLPPEIANRVTDEPNTLYSVTCIAASGASTLDELALARSLLHDKVYRHKKVRATEAMVASILASLAALVDDPTTLPLKLHDEELLDLTADRVRELLGDVGVDDRGRIATALDIVRRLRHRELFVGCFSWSQHPEKIGSWTEEQQTEGLHTLLLHLRRTQQRGDLAEKIAGRVRDILQLAEGRVPGEFEGLRLKNYIWIDPPAVSKGRGLLARAYLCTSEGNLERFRDLYPDTEGWSDQYLVNREIGYVFGPRRLASAIYLATEEVFRTTFGVRVDARRAHVDTSVPALELSKMRSRLDRAGYYTGKPVDLAPLPAVLCTAGAKQRIRSFVERSSRHMAPVRDPAASERLALSSDHVVDFLRQFRDPASIAKALELLERIRIVTRSDVIEALSRFLTSRPEFRGACLSSLGDLRDSSAVLSYIAGDLSDEWGLKHVLPSEMSSDYTHVLFVDDVIGSGRQSVDILEVWLGVKRSFDLGEVRYPLPLPAAANLRSKTLGFVFVAGFREGKKRLEERLAELGVPGYVHVELQEEGLPFAFPDQEKDAAFVAKARDIGKKLLMANGKSLEHAESHALGYGNRGLLLVSLLNTPAQTLTLLWEHGCVDGEDWVPLFPRRRKA